MGDFADQVNVPLVSALIFGLIGAFAPCQLSTGVAAMSYVARRAGEPRRVWAESLAYLAGKASVYLVLGGILVAAGLELGDQVRGMTIVARASDIPHRPHGGRPPPPFGSQPIGRRLLGCPGNRP